MVCGKLESVSLTFTVYGKQQELKAEKLIAADRAPGTENVGIEKTAGIYAIGDIMNGLPAVGALRREGGHRLTFSLSRFSLSPPERCIGRLFSQKDHLTYIEW